jgi:hypothetical protein
MPVDGSMLPLGVDGGAGEGGHTARDGNRDFNKGTTE